MNSIVTYTRKANNSLFGIGTNIKKTLTNWVEKSKVKKTGLDMIQKVLDNPELDNPYIKRLLSDLARDYKYKRHDLEEYFDSYKGRENISNIAWDVLNENK